MDMDSLEENIQTNTEARDREVHPLHGGQARSVFALKKVLACDERSGDGRYTLEALAEI